MDKLKTGPSLCQALEVNIIFMIPSGRRQCRGGPRITGDLSRNASTSGTQKPGSGPQSTGKWLCHWEEATELGP